MRGVQLSSVYIASRDRVGDNEVFRAFGILENVHLMKRGEAVLLRPVSAIAFTGRFYFELRTLIARYSIMGK